MRCKNSWFIIAALAAGVALGCSDGPKNAIVPVEGSIKFADGRTLPAGTKLLFNPVEGEVGAALGTTAADGAFRVTHGSGEPGAETGKYTVLLRAPEGMDAEFYQTVPEAYHSGGVLTAEVTEGMSPLEFVVGK